MAINMELQTKFIRSQLNLFKPFVVGCSLDTARKGQDKIGALMSTIHRNNVVFSDCSLGASEGTMVMPKDEISGGIILYLHGGGYTCGDLTYAKGFGAILAARCGIRVFCSAYRLAPEAPYPAALDDALTAYDYVLSLGYTPAQVVLCGESAGGGLIYCLALKLKQLGRPMPAGLVAMSPWTDLTSSGESFVRNKEIDPSMTRERLVYFADCYVHGKTDGIDDMVRDRQLKTDPLVSPLYGELAELPPSLIFVGGDEVMLDDARGLYDKLRAAGCGAQLVVKPGMWHAYVLYCLKENDDDFETLRHFLKEVRMPQKKLRWMRLDNAAKIYPAAKTREWSNFFRVSATMDETVDPQVLQSALDVTLRRFPSIAVRLRRGVFWYYLEEIPHAPKLLPEECYPLYRMPFDDIRKCAFRIRVYGNRIAAEFFHAITDGTGGFTFLKSLVAEYITQKYNVRVPAECGVLDRLRQPDAAELEDSFLIHAAPVCASRKEPTAFHLSGTKEPDGFCTNTTLMMDAAQVHALAKSYGATVTAFLTAVLIQAGIAVQEQQVRRARRRKPVRVLIPVNLRKLFPSRSMRNFALYTTPGADVRLGTYSLKELCTMVQHQMGLEVTAKQMGTRIATNVRSEQSWILKIMPLFIKNAAMKAVFNAVGERKSCFCFSNLGVVQLPEEMHAHITRMDFILGVQAHAPYNVGALTYGKTMYLNFIRNIHEPLLEQPFYEILHRLGVHIRAESNQRDEAKE